MTDQDANTSGEDPDGRTKDIFKKMDTNCDGVLSKQEFIEGCMNDETLFKLLACTGTDATGETMDNDTLDIDEIEDQMDSTIE